MYAFVPNLSLKENSFIAIIDIGSNSIRLVIYTDLSRISSIFYNEKLTCSLGRNVGKTGKIDEEALRLSLSILERFQLICQNLNVKACYILATAAVRDAQNGQSFLKRAQGVLKQNIIVLTGEEEAFYGALAIKSSFYQAKGLVGDMGGGSLELCAVDEKEMSLKTTYSLTLPLGGLMLQALAKKDLKEARSLIRYHLKKFSSWSHFLGQNFYAIGGTWRNIAQLYMAYENYPLKMLHAYEVDTKKFYNFLHKGFISKTLKMPKLSMISKKRRPILPYGALLCVEIIDHMKPEKIIFSTFGLREGYHYHLLGKEEKCKDPLIARAKALSKQYSRSYAYGPLLYQWLATIIKYFLSNHNFSQREQQTLCYLFDIFWQQDMKSKSICLAEFVAYNVCFTLSHKQVALMALCLFFIMDGRIYDLKPYPVFSKILTEKEVKQAQLLAVLIQIANHFSFFAPKILKNLSLRKQEEDFSFCVPQAFAPLCGEKFRILLKQLEKLSKQKIKLRFI